MEYCYNLHILWGFSMIIDFHAHIYPEKIAEKAAKAIGLFYDAPIAYNGTSLKLIESGSKIGVDKYVVHSAATTEAQVESINNFIIKECDTHSEFIGFGTMHPNYTDFEKELERIKKEGLKGIKLHPDFQKFKVDCPEMDPIYEKLAELKMPVLFHAGDCRFDFSGPKRILNVYNKHPSLIIIAAHFGGYTEWQESLDNLVGKDIYFDTSSTLWKLPLEKANQMIKAHGYEKFFFGSDYPMWDHEDELSRFNQLDLTAEEREAVLYKNALKLFERIK